jgi:ADP-L-glycero-D-manno-heptose 6-epimerase
MIVVTGGAGFIGSNLVKALNNRGYENVVVVDDLTAGIKFKNLVDCQLQDYLDKDIFLKKIQTEPSFAQAITAIFHQGACSDTTEWNGRFMLENNYEYSKQLLHCCMEYSIPLIYASSAAVYGNSQTFSENPSNEAPLNVYGYSKLLFDQYVRRYLPQMNNLVVGLRYFNVYGPREAHKGSMISVAYQLNQQLSQSDKVKLFAGYEAYGDGEQRRDFIYVEDIVKVNLWFLDKNNIKHKGIYNLGTGASQTFNEVANAVIHWHQRGTIDYIPFPEHLRGHYQSFTEADISALRGLGYDAAFASVEEGVGAYLDWLANTK